MQAETILTPQTAPGHDVIGLTWMGFNGQLYFCDSYDPRRGFWMTNIRDLQDRRNISERAPNRTFHAFCGEVKRPDIRDDHDTYFVVDCLADEPQALAVDVAKARAAPSTCLVLFDKHDARIAAIRVTEAEAAIAS